MRWLFLAFILLLAFAGNWIIFEQFSILRVLGSISINLFMVSLLLYWKYGYFNSGSSQSRGLIIGHALMMLAAGLGLGLIGTNSILTGSCEHLEGRRLGHDLIAYIQSQGHCQWLGTAFILLGLVLATPSIHLFKKLAFNGE